MTISFLLLEIKKIFALQYQNNIKLKIQLSLFYIISFLFVFAFFRLLFCLAYPEFFAMLSFLEKAKYFFFRVAL
jgi:hypothetical protein